MDDLNSDDLEQQCEDALFEACDARERFPLLCAKELETCIKLTNEICMTKVFIKPAKTLNVSPFTNEQPVLIQKSAQSLSEANELLKMQEHKLQIMINKIENLTVVLEQIKRDKLCEINKLLWD